MRAKVFFALTPLLLNTACYRVTVVTGAPAVAQTVDKPWAMSFAYGIAPPPELDVKDACKEGVASVVTERSFLNGFVSTLTSSVVSPIHTRVTCAAGAVGK